MVNPDFPQPPEQPSPELTEKQLIALLPPYFQEQIYYYLKNDLESIGDTGWPPALLLTRLEDVLDMANQQLQDINPEKAATIQAMEGLENFIVASMQSDLFYREGITALMYLVQAVRESESLWLETKRIITQHPEIIGKLLSYSTSHDRLFAKLCDASWGDQETTDTLIDLALQHQGVFGTGQVGWLKPIMKYGSQEVSQMAYQQTITFLHKLYPQVRFYTLTEIIENECWTSEGQNIRPIIRHSKIFEVVKTIFREVGLDANELFLAWFASPPELRELPIPEQIEAIGELEKIKPGMAAILVNKLGIKKFSFSKHDHKITNIEDLLQLDQDYQQSGIAWQREKAIVEQFSLDFESLKQTWQEANFDLVEGVKDNISAIKRVEELRPGSTKVLLAEFGIRNFCRYPIDLLVKQYDQRHQLIPYGLAICAIFDPNDAFQKVDEELTGLDRQLTGHYALRVVEAGSKAELTRRLIRLHQRYHPDSPDYTHQKAKPEKGQAIAFALIFAHGTPWSFQLGRWITNDDSNGYLFGDLRDNNLGVKRAKKIFAQGAPFVFLSCSAGEGDENISKELAKSLEAMAIAPDEIINSETIVVSFDDQNRPKFEVTYNRGSTQVFSGRVDS